MASVIRQAAVEKIEAEALALPVFFAALMCSQVQLRGLRRIVT